MPRSRRHYRVTIEDVLLAHHLALEFFGGRPGVLNIGLARSAIGRPYSGYHRSIHRKAAALVHSLAKNHAFVDGNKRTALYVMHLRLIRSGYRLRGEDNPALQNELEDMILDVATGQMDFEALVQWFEDRIVRVTRTLESG